MIISVYIHIEVAKYFGEAIYHDFDITKLLLANNIGGASYQP